MIEMPEFFLKHKDCLKHKETCRGAPLPVGHGSSRKFRLQDGARIRTRTPQFLDWSHVRRLRHWALRRKDIGVMCRLHASTD